MHHLPAHQPSLSLLRGRHRAKTSAVHHAAQRLGDTIGCPLSNLPSSIQNTGGSCTIPFRLESSWLTLWFLAAGTKHRDGALLKGLGIGSRIWLWEYTEYVSVCGVFGTDSVDFTLEAIRGHILCAFTHCLVTLIFVAFSPQCRMVLFMFYLFIIYKLYVIYVDI